MAEIKATITTNAITAKVQNLGGTGTVTSVAVVSANGFGGTVANYTTTPAITLSTTITGLLKGVAGALAQAVAGIDYLSPASVIPIAQGGTGQVTAPLGLNALLPTQSGQVGKVLQTDGANASWVPSAATPTWGGIVGTLSNQTDLQNALNAKQNTGSYEVTTNKENTTIDTSTTKYPTVNLLKTGLDGKQNTGSYELSTNKVTSISGSSTDVQYPSAKLLYDQLAGKQASGSYEVTTNKVTSISGSSTDTQYPSAKLVYDQLAGKQASGSYEVTSNKENVTIDTSTSKYPTVNLLKTGLDGKEPTLAKGNLTEATSSILTISNGNNSVIGTGTSIQVKQASGSQDGYLSQGDWTTFNGKQSAIGFTPENVANKSTNVTTDGSSDTKYPSVKATKDYADSLVVGLLDYRGAYNASGNVFPSTGGSGSAGAILKGDMWVISVAGTLGGQAVQIGDSLIANVDTPDQTASNWNILNGNISYVPEDQANKVTSISSGSTDVQYPSAKLLYDQLGGKQDSNSNLLSLAGLTFVSTSFVKMTAANTFGLDTATYEPSFATLPTSKGGTGLDTSAVTDGQLLIGKTSDNTWNRATLTAGANIAITNGAGSISIAATAGPTMYECTVASAGADYATLGAAITAGKKRMLLISSTTETATITLPDGLIVHSIAEENIIDMGAYNFTATDGHHYEFADLELRVTSSLGTGYNFSDNTFFLIADNVYFHNLSATNPAFRFSKATLYVKDCNINTALQTGFIWESVATSNGHFINNLTVIGEANPSGFIITEGSASYNKLFISGLYLKGTFAQNQTDISLGGNISNFANQTNDIIVRFYGGASSPTLLSNFKIRGGVIFDTGLFEIANGFVSSASYSSSINPDNINISNVRFSNMVSLNGSLGNYHHVYFGGTFEVGASKYGNIFQACDFVNATITDNGYANSFLNCRYPSTVSSTQYEKEFIKMKNTSGSAVTVGMVVTLKAVAGGDEVTTSTTIGDSDTFGVVATASIANGSIGYVQISGKCTTLKVNGTTDIAIGDYISTYSVAGIGQKATLKGVRYIAKAFEAYATDNSSGVIDAWIEPGNYWGAGNISLADGENMVFGTTTGSLLGTTTSQKLGLWGKTPIIQPASANQAALTNSTGGSYDGTLEDVTGTPTQAAINNNFTDIYTLLTEIRTALVNAGIIKGAA